MLTTIYQLFAFFGQVDGGLAFVQRFVGFSDELFVNELFYDAGYGGCIFKRKLADFLSNL